MLDIDLFPSPLQLEAAAAWYMHAFVAVVLSIAAMIALLGQASALCFHEECWCMHTITVSL